MNGPHHVVIGSVVTFGTLVTLQASGFEVQQPEIIGGVAVAALASLMPDIDHESSTISRTAFPIALIGILMWIWPTLFAAFRVPSMDSQIVLVRSLFSAWSDMQAAGALFIVLSLALVFVPKLFDHRREIHSLLFFVITSIVVYLSYTAMGFHWALPLGYSFGFGLHLLTDYFTSDSLPYLFWPFDDDIDYD